MRKKILFSSSVFVAGLCSIVYELLISTTATYFLGDGVKQFSIIIGVYLFSMGAGAFVSKYFMDRSLFFFVKIEYVLGFIGGISVPLIYFLFVSVSPMILQILCLVIVFLIGMLTGMEVPLLTFAIDDDIKNNLSNILSLDYIGGLVATLIFPFLLLPFVGLFYSSLIFGLVNILMGLTLNLIYYKDSRRTVITGVVFIIALVTLVLNGGSLLKAWDDRIYKNPIVFNEQTAYQKIVLTKRQKDVRLYLNRVIQFSSEDEHRYHESLVHIPLSFLPKPKTVLILGGGENLASREVLKHADIDRIDVVDIDSMMFHIARTNAYLRNINRDAARDKRVHLIAEDAFTFLNNNIERYDLIIADLPDPSSEAIARLYSKQFFLMVKRSLSDDGIFVTQAGEIYFSNTVFSCINNTLQQVFKQVKPFHAYIPSFGDWGFVMASSADMEPAPGAVLPEELRFLTAGQLAYSFMLPKDIAVSNTSVNTLDNPIILNYYLDDWEKWKQDFMNTTSEETGESILF
jgi:spermidine synthase